MAEKKNILGNQNENEKSNIVFSYDKTKLIKNNNYLLNRTTKLSNN